MKMLTLEVPDQLAEQIKNLVEEGWFVSESELARLALAEFVRHHRFDLQEQFQREDIHWAAGLKNVKG